MKTLLATLFCMMPLLLSGHVYSADDAADIVLKISGKDCCNHNGKMEYTRQQLLALPQTSVPTTTPWTKGTHVYRGVLLRSLLDTLDISAKSIKVTAQNDYFAAIPREDGKALTLRNKGPVWIIYPLSDHPELNIEQYHSLMVWQVVKLEGM
ncbi:molybdopterin-binding oxidoreductase [Aeromonas bestiarum]|uniref:molybdopterin-binding oxidoreductase n=1 Tax=Aeromonas bestiarum TaxID=105751 RepID=UPI000CD3BA4A|nr:molybdopterin-binding oxidoreductase [Aeromonas bestiarum]POG25263.1 molybdopterin-binding oxidoreductase [Aeromonas bestiarum]